MTLPRKRPVVGGRHGAVASAHPLASQAGLDILRDGGNAVDAVVTMAATLAVVEPYMSGPGGVGFLLLHRPGAAPRVLNYSGTSPTGAVPGVFDEESREVGPKSALVPANVAGWFEAIATEGTRSPADIFAAGIRHGRDGFPLHPANALFIDVARPRLNDVGQKVFGGLESRIGEIHVSTDLANTYARLVEEGPELFYTGELGQRLADYIQEQGGLITREDMANYRPEWEDPIEVNYRGLTVRTPPPNNEGMQILETLKILEGFDLASLGHNSTEYIHLLSEAIKLAVADRIRWCGDPKFSPVPLDQLLSEAYAVAQRERIDHDRATLVEGERWGGFREGDFLAPGKIDGLTTHLSAVDAEGNVASITQSLGNGFGSGVMIPDTGVLLNNFVYWTETDPACTTPNRIEPGKRWSCCMAPVHVVDGENFWFSIATPGSYGILQTTMQMLLNIVEFGADVQAAIEAPRFRVWEDTRMQIEDRVPGDVRGALETRGHALEDIGDFSPQVGGGQGVLVDPQSGARLAGADPRRDGYALAY
ncbi:MAG: gamma-glutamyltransferase family protein [Planctomycetota bacterium]|nr:gamma-glutamyltransferase family protein [Planctomycetota bacterium]